MSILRDIKNIKIDRDLFVKSCIHFQKGNNLLIRINNLYLHYNENFFETILVIKYLFIIKL